MTNILSKEPALITGLVAAIITLLVAYGVNITDGQTTAIMGAIGAVIALAQAFVTRQQVVPTQAAEAMVSDAEAKAYEDGLYTEVPTSVDTELGG